ncbi:hypothetical protein HDU98_009493 [Podochytrium sp. JEL0797]|nr:hypothetical protein HDU98_009493 [Podochytrium sp. JEL0797]
MKGIEDQQVGLWLMLSNIHLNRLEIAPSLFHDLPHVNPITNSFEHRISSSTIVVHYCKSLPDFFICMANLFEQITLTHPLVLDPTSTQTHLTTLGLNLTASTLSHTLQHSILPLLPLPLSEFSHHLTTTILHRIAAHTLGFHLPEPVTDSLLHALQMHRKSGTPSVQEETGELVDRILLAVVTSHVEALGVSMMDVDLVELMRDVVEVVEVQRRVMKGVGVVVVDELAMGLIVVANVARHVIAREPAVGVEERMGVVKRWNESLQDTGLLMRDVDISDAMTSFLEEGGGNDKSDLLQQEYIRNAVSKIAPRLGFRGLDGRAGKQEVAFVQDAVQVLTPLAPFQNFYLEVIEFLVVHISELMGIDLVLDREFLERRNWILSLLESRAAEYGGLREGEVEMMTVFLKVRDRMEVIKGSEDGVGGGDDLETWKIASQLLVVGREKSSNKWDRPSLPSILPSIFPLPRMIRNKILFCMFWTKVFIALLMSTSCLFYFSWRIYDLHSHAIATSGGANLLDTVTIFNPDGTVAPKCMYDPSKGFARLEPQISNQMTFGFSLDWSYDTPTRVVNKLNGYKPLVFNTFMEFNINLPGYFDNSSLNWFGSEAGRVGAILELTMQPTSPVTSYTQVHLDALSAELFNINTRYGVPVLMRFGHEMNGPWTTYAFDPTGFIPLFRNMAASVRKVTNMTAMVWAPNVGFGYPFTGSGAVPLPLRGTPNFALLDTNNDGVIDDNDNPYSPYYPGDDVVDWVGVSLYYYPPDEVLNHAIPPGYFDAYLTGIGYNQLPTPQWVAAHDFYSQFCQGTHMKPMMLPETGAPFLNSPTAAGTPGPSASVPGDTLAVSGSAIKEQWFASIFNSTVLTDYPKLKLVVNFEEEKLLGGYFRDWRLTNDSATLQPFLAEVNSFSRSLPQASAFRFGCDGSVMLA